MGLQISTQPAGVSKAAKLQSNAAKAQNDSFQTEASKRVCDRQFIEVGVSGT